MRIASYNVQSLFERAKALALPDWKDGREVLEQHAEVNELLAHSVYTPADKARIVELLKSLGLGGKDDAGRFALLRQNRGHLIKRSKGKLEVVADGRDDWVGWVELKTEPVNEEATRSTARVIKDVAADVLGVVEAENRISLRDFSSVMLEKVGGKRYEHVMLIDGNDGRGIDVGILTRGGFEIESIRSHVDDGGPASEIFSRDCPEYTISTPSGKRLVVLVNHFKSKGFGKAADNDARRKRQAARVAEIYTRLKNEGQKNVVVLGDLNDTPDSAPLAPLLQGTDLRDVSTHPKFTSDGRPGTFGNGTKGSKFDYVLLSPALFAKVQSGAVFRKGVWGGKNGTLWEIYPTMKRPVHAASDHAAVIADIDL